MRSAGEPLLPIAVGVTLTQVAVFATSIYLHRALAHRPDRLDRVLFSRGVLGLGLGVAGLCLVVGPGAGLPAGLLHAVLYVLVVAPLINAVGHWRGERNFENTARNSAILALVTGGESLHNNHHARPHAAKFSVRAGEFDPSWPVIRTLAATRLLSVAGAPHGTLVQFRGHASPPVVGTRKSSRSRRLRVPSGAGASSATTAP
jgi:fatty-acid desaturase